MFNISTDSSSLNFFLFSFSNLVQITEKTNTFSKMYHLLSTNNKIDYFHLNLFSYGKYFIIYHIFIFNRRNKLV